MRYLPFIASLFILCGSALAADQQLIKDCDYWRLGEDEAEKARRRAACDSIIKDQHFDRAARAMAYAERAGYASQGERNDDAITDLTKALELEPDHYERRRDRAFLLHFKNEHERALADFDKIIAANPSIAHNWFYRGLTYLRKGEETRGFADMAKGIELAPDDQFYRYWRGVEHAKRGRTDAAIADLDKAIALKDDDLDAYLLRSDLYTKKGDTEKAIADLTRAAELRPERTVIYTNRALLYEQSRQYDLAFADYDKLLSLSPGDGYYSDRKNALLERLAKAPPVDVTPRGIPQGEEPMRGPEPVPEADAEPELKKAERSPETVIAPAPERRRPATVGKGECRRYDAIANTTIAIACPD